jgi:hypothetical protein
LSDKDLLYFDQKAGMTLAEKLGRSNPTINPPIDPPIVVPPVEDMTSRLVTVKEVLQRDVTKQHAELEGRVAMGMVARHLNEIDMHQRQWRCADADNSTGLDLWTHGNNQGFCLNGERVMYVDRPVQTEEIIRVMEPVVVIEEKPQVVEERPLVCRPRIKVHPVTHHVKAHKKHAKYKKHKVTHHKRKAVRPHPHRVRRAVETEMICE